MGYDVLLHPHRPAVRFLAGLVVPQEHLGIRDAGLRTPMDLPNLRGFWGISEWAPPDWLMVPALVCRQAGISSRRILKAAIEPQATHLWMLLDMLEQFPRKRSQRLDIVL